MILDFILNTLPVWFTRLYGLICESALYRFLGAVWRGLCGLCRGSLIAGIAGEHAGEGAKSGTGVFARAADALLRFPVWLADKLIGASCALKRILYSVHGDYETFAGICILFIFLCPGAYWHNIYGLAITLVLLLALVVMTAMKKRSVISVSSLGLSFVVFVLSSVIGVLVANDRADALRVFVFFATAFMLTLILAADINDRAKLKKILGFIYTAVIAAGVYAVYQRLAGVKADASLTDLTLNSNMPGRVFSTFENPNNYAEILVLTIPLCVAYCSMIKQKTARLAAWVLTAIPVGSLLMTYSRSGWVSFAIAAFVFVFLYNKKLVPVFLVLCIAAVPLLPASVLARITTIGSTADSSNMYRIYIWEGVLRMLKEFWPSGVGLGPLNFRAVYAGVSTIIAKPAPHSHMLFLEIWTEQGIIGLLAYISMLFSVVRRSLISLKYATHDVRITLIAGVSSLTGILFASTAEYIWYYPRVMLTYFMVVGILYACIRMARTEGDTLPEPSAD